MRVSHNVLWMACIGLAAAWPLPAQGQQTDPFRPESDAAPAKTGAQAAPRAAASADRKDTRLTLEDVQELRRQLVSAEKVAEKIAEQGRGFEVTAEVVEELRRLGFRPAQIDAIKESSDEPLVPGKSLTTSDEERERTFREMKQVAAKSGAAIEPIQSQHVTLWAAKDVQQTFLQDVEKLEKFFHTKCAEPSRSGLDKRSTHIVLLKDHAEYEAWCRAMFDLFGKQFEDKDNPGAYAEYRERILKAPVFNQWYFSALSLGELPFDWAHRDVACDVGCMYVIQLANPRRPCALETGFANWAEAVVAGWPSTMFSEFVYHGEDRKSREARYAWSLLVRQRVATNRATPPGKLLQMGLRDMSQPHFAEAWTLVGLLSEQPVKFGKLLLTMREGVSELEAIEKVYGWDEKKLTKEWHAYVMGQGKKGVKSRD